ncbi:MAG: hypothetical protein NWF00_06100 [Candidatus Bathyarchaeota archaeon]|nr:hypothetical protein [Candidatus Bathyarchaeota archaeon]
MEQKDRSKFSVFSPAFLILVVVCAYFLLAGYEVFVSYNFARELILNFPTYSKVMEMPWWIATFYSSELGGGVGSVFRFAASILAVYCAFVYWRKGADAFQQIRRKVAAALALEAGYFLMFIPSAWLGFVFPTTGGNVWYFEITPVPEVFFVAGVSCLAMVLAVPPVLFKLRSLVVHGASRADLLRWSGITAVVYLFVVFWFNSTMQWIGMIATWGTGLVLEPMNFLGFASTVFGLFLVAVFGLVVAYPAIKKQPNPLNPKHVGAVCVAFGGYFVFAVLVYFLAGGFEANRSAWYEMIVPHNPYIWCLIFLFTGLPLLLMKPKIK